MKHQIVHTIQKYLLNPPIKLVLAAGLPLPGYGLLETKGRKTEKKRRTPVGDGRVGDQFWVEPISKISPHENEDTSRL